MKSLRIITLLAGLMLAFTISAAAQVTVTNPGNTTPGLALTYGSLAAAITDLNTQTAISGPVTITLDSGNPQTAPSGGYAITALLTGASAANTVTIEGSANIITAASPAGAVGALNDGFFKFIGSDFMTLQNFSMTENAANTTTAAATNNMMEWGVALLYATSTNGAQNITVQNNTITLNRAYQNTFGIYSNSTHTAGAVTTSASATTTAGGNSGLKIYGNTISNVNNGIVVVGPTAAADANTGIDIGGAGGAQANSITNYGTTGTFSGYANVSGTVNGILVRNSNGFNVSFNTVSSSVGGTTVGTLNGIQVPAASAAPTTTFTNNINSNNISLQSGLAAGVINGITYPSGSASATSVLNINSNNFNTFGHTVAGATGAITFISHASIDLTQSISNNTFTNMTVNTTGSVTFISNTNTLPASGLKNVNTNLIVTGFSKTGAGGTITGFTDNGSSPSTATNNSNNNNFSNITITGATTVTGISNTDGLTSVTKNVTGNTVSNITGGTTNTVTGINVTSGGTTIVSGNTVSGITNGGTINGITTGTSTTNSISQNTVHTLTATGTGTASGFVNSGGTTVTMARNKVYNIENNNAGGAVSGLTVSGGTNVTAQNNLIGDLRTTAANAANPLIGLNITGGTTVNAYFNTIYLNGSSSGALFGSSAVSVSTTPTVTLRNNIFYNNSTIMGAGLAVAHRRSSTTLTSYASASNNNDFSASTIYTDGTNTDVGIAAYKTRVSPRDANSFAEVPNFVSTTGANANFLHINTGIATQIESGGASVAGITDDFDGDVRGALPDIGADEFTGIGIDLSPPAITYTNLGSTALTANRVLATSISDATAVAGGALSPRIYFKKSTDAGYVSTQCVLAIAPNYNCTIDYTLVGGGSVTAGDIIQYYVIAQDTLGNIGSNPGGVVATDVNTVTTPPTPNSYTILAIINSFPYSQDFEANNGGWTAGITAGTTSDWEYGTFAKTTIPGPFSGTKAWVTKLVGNYSVSTTSTLTSPVIDFSALTGRPTFTFRNNFDESADPGFDAGILEYSIDGGTTWIKVDATLGTGGTFNTTDSTNWYNSSSTSGAVTGVTQPKWSGNSNTYTGHTNGWVLSSTLLPAAVVGQSDVRLRFRFGSETSIVDEGWAVDDVSITPPSPGVVQFSTVAFAGNENTTATITVTRTGGSAGAISVMYATSDGSATGSVACVGAADYLSAGGTLNWADGDSVAKTFTVQLCADAVVDPAETVSLTLSGQTGGATIGANNPAVLTIVDVPPPFNGSYTVGSGGNYPSLTNAGGIFAAINSSGATGNITINILGNLSGETGAVSLNQIAGGFTTLIKPSIGVSPTISGSAASCLINLNGADFVTIDGSNAIGGMTKDLTISNTATTGGTVCFVNEATNNVVKNSLIKGVSTSTLNGVVFFSTAPTGVTGNSTNTVQNNDISGGATATAYGVFNNGTNAAKNANNIITQNRIFDFSNTGLRDDGNSVNTNYIANEIFEVTTQTTSLTGFRPSNTNIDGFVFNRNNIHDLKTTSTGTVYGIHLFDTSTLNTSVISNNMITLTEVTPLTLRGIWDQTAIGEKYNLYYNSVYIGGTVTGVSNSEAYFWSIASTTDAKNNIFVNARTGGTGKHYAYRTNTTLANLTSDFNDIFATGGTANVFGNNGTADVADLTTWRLAPTTGTGKDASSVSGDPLYTPAAIAAGDLHIVSTTTVVVDKGIAVSVLDDFDGQIRSMVGLAGGVPDIGADEALAPLAANASITGRVVTSYGAGIRNAIVVVTGGGLTEPRSYRTNNFGNYRFTDLEVGQTYVLTINSKRFVFTNPTLLITLEDNVSDANFVAYPE